MESLAFRDINRRIVKSEKEILDLKSRLAHALVGDTVAASHLPPHGFLSTTHIDTTIAGPTRGDIVVAQGASPTWARLAKPSPAAGVRYGLTFDNGDNEPSWKPTVDSVAPTTIAPSAVAASGTSLIYARRDHTHGAPATWAVAIQDEGVGQGNAATLNFVGAGVTAAVAAGVATITVTASSSNHDLLDGSQDQDTVAHTVVLGDLIYGNATPKWQALAGNITGTKKFLTQTGTGAVSAAPAWGLVTAADVSSGAALTKTDDTNVTLTLTGSPTVALLATTNIALGWTGTLAVARGGTGVGALGDITKVDDTNVTLALGGTPLGAVITSTSFTLGWNGTLAVARGGIGVGTLLLNGVLYGNGTSAVQAVALNAAGTNKFLRQVSSGAPTFAAVDYADLTGATPTVAITMTYYFEVNFLATSGTHIARLFDISANIEVSGSQITTTSTTSARVRSSAITFISGHEYRVEFGGLAGGSYTIFSADVVVAPSNGPTTYITFGNIPVGGQTSTP